MVPSFGALLCLKVLWTWGDEEKWTLFEGFDYSETKCSCILALFFLLHSLFSSRCQSLGMLDIRSGMMLKQTKHNGKIISSHCLARNSKRILIL